MSDITPTQTSTTLRLKPAINDANTAQNRGQGTSASSPNVATGSVPITDSVTLSATAQAISGGQTAATSLTDEEAQNTAADLRQQISLQGLSASAKQNAAVLALIRPRR